MYLNEANSLQRVGPDHVLLLYEGLGLTGGFALERIVIHNVICSFAY